MQFYVFLYIFTHFLSSFAQLHASLMQFYVFFYFHPRSKCNCLEAPCILTHVICSFFSGLGRKKREASDIISERQKILKTIENYLPVLVPMPFNTTGHDCMLRTICEMAHTPQNGDGLFGDFINLLLAPSYLLDHELPLTLEKNDYLEAQKTGHFMQDCRKYHEYCPLSLFQIDDFHSNLI